MDPFLTFHLSFTWIVTFLKKEQKRFLITVHESIGIYNSIILIKSRFLLRTLFVKIVGLNEVKLGIFHFNGTSGGIPFAVEYNLDALMKNSG